MVLVMNDLTSSSVAPACYQRPANTSVIRKTLPSFPESRTCTSGNLGVVDVVIIVVLVGRGLPELAASRHSERSRGGGGTVEKWEGTRAFAESAVYAVAAKSACREKGTAQHCTVRPRLAGSSVLRLAHIRNRLVDVGVYLPEARKHLVIELYIISAIGARNGILYDAADELFD